jgi:Tfp pilus assembly protein PilV
MRHRCENNACDPAKPRVYTRGSICTSRGFLLIEGMIASVILAVAAVAIASLLLSANEEATVMRENATAASLAGQLLEEIAAKPLGTYPWAAVPAARPLFTYAEDYRGFSDDTSTITTLATNALALPGDGGLFQRSVSVIAQAGPTGSTAPMGDFALVTVTVTTPSGRTISISRLIARTDWST